MRHCLAVNRQRKGKVFQSWIQNGPTIELRSLGETEGAELKLHGMKQLFNCST